MKKKFSEELDEFIEKVKIVLDELKRKKNRLWILPVVMVTPLFFPDFWVLGIIFLTLYLACNSNDNNCQ